VPTTELALLFGSAFLAATVLPFYSEVGLYLLLERGGDPLLLVAVATVGNTLGALLNWYLGLQVLRFRHRRWFYFSERQLAAGQRWFNRYGYWSLLLAWLPLGGDAIPLVAGIMRVPLWRVALLAGIGKALRYLVVVLIAPLP
jgi:membrane protein YqaA with SNARE-associated domain